MSTQKISDLQLRTPLAWLVCALFLAWGVGMFGRGYWTPDEPREADITWRMSWQADKAVPLLAGEAFCEKPPLTYWLAALPVKLFGASAWAARLPNLLYALITALSVGMLAARSAGRFAALVGAGCISTFLLAYQVAIWLATDAPLLASVSAALLGAYIGFYAANRNERLRGYLLMHAALGLGFLCKSAVAWMVPALAILTLSIWEKRWRELLRWELYAGLLLQAAMILTWVWFVYAGADGPAHLKVFFWNNLVGRFAAVDAPPELQYASAHRNFPGKYLLELPIYLFPWTLLVIAAAARAWRRRTCRPGQSRHSLCAGRFLAAFAGAFRGCDGAQRLFCAGASRDCTAGCGVGTGNSARAWPLRCALIAAYRRAAARCRRRFHHGVGADRRRRLVQPGQSRRVRGDFCARHGSRRLAGA